MADKGIYLKVYEPGGVTLIDTIEVSSWEFSPGLNRTGNFSFAINVENPAFATCVVEFNEVVAWEYNSAGSYVSRGEAGIITKISPTLTANAGLVAKVSGKCLLWELGKDSIAETIIADEEDVVPLYAQAHHPPTYGTEATVTPKPNWIDDNPATSSTFTLTEQGPSEEYLYIGHNARFKGIYLGFNTPNAVAGVSLLVQYFTGAYWNSVTFADGTDVAGTPLAQDGWITWDYPADEYKLPHGADVETSVRAYWIRIINLGPSSDEMDIHTLEIRTDGKLANDVETIMDNAPTWSLSGYTGSTGGTLSYYKGQTVLAMLVDVAKRTGDNFILDGATRTVKWLKKDHASSGITAGEYTQAQLEADTNKCLITDIGWEDEAEKLVTKIYPAGAGSGEVQANLSLADLSMPTGYSMSTSNNYIVNNDAEATYGVSWSTYIDFRQISTVRGTGNNRQLSNELASAALAWLQEASQVHRTYKLTVDALRASLKPGDTITVVFNRNDNTGASAVAINEVLNVIGIKRRVSSKGQRSVEIDVSTRSRRGVTDAEAMGDALRQAQASARNIQTVDAKTVDGYAGPSGGGSGGGGDLAAHAADPNAHHNQSHVLATTSALGPDHTVSGLTSGYVLKATGATTAVFAALNYSELANRSHVLADTSGLGADHTVSGLTSGQVMKATGPNTAVFVALNYSELANRTHSITSEHSIGGSAGDLVGNTGGSVALITPVSDGNTTKNRVLKTDTNGLLIVTTLETAGGAEVGTTLDVLGELYVAGTIGGASGVLNTAGDRVGIGMIPDAQFALDINGNIRWSGYGVGQMALQVEGVTALFHYDGVLTGHMGQAGTNTGIIFDEGKFGRGIFADVSITNRVVNPRFMGTYASGLAPNYTAYTNGTGAGTRSEEALPFCRSGTKAQRVNRTSGAGTSSDRYGFSCTYTAAGGTKSMMSVWVYVTSYTSGAIIRLQANSSAGPGSNFLSNEVTITNSMVGKWTKITATDSSHTATSGTVTLYAWIATQNANVVFDQFFMAEGIDYDIPFFSGADDGATWASTADASASTKPASNATYSTGTLGITPAVGTVMFWLKLLSPNSADTKNTVRLYTGASDYLALYISGASNTLYCDNSTNVISTNIGTLANTDWTHIAYVWEIDQYPKVYINGVEVVVIGGTLLSTSFTLPTTMYVGSNQASTNPLKGILDELVWVDRAMPAAEILAVYGSNAPVFAPSSTFEFSAGPEQLVWANENGLFMRDVEGNAVLAATGRDGISWGGFTMNSGDFLIGNSTEGYLRWDNDNGSGASQLEINALIKKLVIGTNDVVLEESQGIVLDAHYDSGGASSSGYNMVRFFRDGDRTDTKHGSIWSWYYDSDRSGLTIETNNTAVTTQIRLSTGAGSAGDSIVLDADQVNVTDYLRVGDAIGVGTGSSTTEAQVIFMQERTTVPATPAASHAVVYIYDTGTQQSLRVKFANGTVKTITTDV